MLKICDKHWHGTRKKQWTHEIIHKASDETINKTYAESMQRELNGKDEKTGKVLGKHFIKLYSTGISRKDKKVTTRY